MNRIQTWSLAFFALVAGATIAASGCSDSATPTTGDPTDFVSGSYALVVAPDATQPLTIAAGSTDVAGTKGLLLRAASECHLSSMNA